MHFRREESNNNFQDSLDCSNKTNSDSDLRNSEIMEFELLERTLLLVVFILSLMVLRAILNNEDQLHPMLMNFIDLIEYTIYFCIGLLFTHILYLGLLGMIPKEDKLKL